MPNEVKILVRVYNSGKAGLDAVNKDVDDYAKKFSETFSRRFSESISQSLNQNLTTRMRTVVDQAGRDVGDRMGNTISERITTRITDRLRTVRDRVSSRSSSSSSARSGGIDRDRERVHVDVDVDRKSFLERISDLGKGAGEKLSDGLRGGITSLFSSDVLSTIIKGAMIGLATEVLAPALGAAISSGVLLALGGGVIGAGVYSAIKNNKQIQGAFLDLAGRAKEAFRDFGENFTGPVANFAENLLGVFKQIRPYVQDIGTQFGPLTDKLGDGIIGFLQNSLPGIMRAIRAAGPIIDTLAEQLPGLGTDIGKFFDHIKASGPGATAFFRDLIEVIGILLRVLGRIIEGLSLMYLVARDVVAGMVRAFLWAGDQILGIAEAAFGWIPGIGTKLERSRKQMRDWSKRITEYINDLPQNRDFTLHAHAVGFEGVARAIVNSVALVRSFGRAAGGVQGAASGGARSGLTLVGEQGPELVSLPAGASVRTAGDTARMLAGSGSAQRLDILLRADRTTERGVIDALLRALRAEISGSYGGNVQLALGSGG